MAGAGESPRRLCRLRCESGQAMVEFALLVPLLVVAALMLVQVGLIATDQVLLTQAAREGAREGAVANDDASARQAVLRSLPEGLRDAQVRVEAPGRAMGDPYTVILSAHPRSALPVVGKRLSELVILRARAVSRIERGRGS